MRKKDIAWGLGVFAVLLGIVYVVGRSPQKRATSFLGQVAPPLTFLLDGKETSLAAYQGKTVLLNFWASWCGPCIEEMPALRALEDRLRDKGFVLLAINVSGEPYDVLKKTPADKLPTLRVHQFNEKDLDAYKIEVIPHSVLVDKEGKAREVFVGPRHWDSESVVAALEKFL